MLRLKKIRGSIQGIVLSGILISCAGPARTDDLSKEVEETMLLASKFMVEKVSYRGGFVWNYLPDLSRSWGEMEAYPSMVWVQPPGTPSMGQLFLDAYHATGDEYYYRAAEQAALALIEGQLECGGWNYIIDFAGESSLKKWYATIGKHGWRLEEFNHYYGNATFDDDATYAPAMFMLRMYLEKHDPVYLESLEKALEFVLESQYPVGGWPQRYPPTEVDIHTERPAYTSYITLNDGVHKNNVEFLISCYRILGDTSLLEPIKRGMNCILLLQQEQPQPGWSWQFTTDLQPAGARTYEPDGLYSGATYHCINLLMDYYELTGDKKFLARMPASIEYLESLVLPGEIAKYYPRRLRSGQQVVPSCIEVGTNRPRYVHRRGSNAINGSYYPDYDPANQWMPTFSMRALDMGQLRERYQKLVSMPPGEVAADSPLTAESPDSTLRVEFPDSPQRVESSDSPLNDESPVSPQSAESPDSPQKVEFPDPIPRYFFDLGGPVEAEEVRQILDELGEKSYWEGVFAGSNPYIGEGPEEVTPGDYSTTQVGDRYDTSPYRFGEDIRGISTQEYIRNMSRLISYLESVRDDREAL